MPKLFILQSPPESVASQRTDEPCLIELKNDGTDWGARINAADAALESTRGVICCNGGGNIASQIVLNRGGSSLRTLRFGPGTWTNGNTTDRTILPHDNVLIEGHGWDTVLQEPPGSNVLSYFLMQPYVDVGAQANNISMRNIQLSGVGISKAPNGASSTVITGLLSGGTYENIWFNKTHAIGLCVGGINNVGPGGPFCRNVIVRGCKFTNVGGGVPPNYPGGGGVSFAIINGDQITLDGCTFIDALGNTVIDLEPNTLDDPITNITISNCWISQEVTTGLCEPYVFGIVIHSPGVGSAKGPIRIVGNTLKGAYGQNGGSAGQIFPTGHLYCGIYVNYQGAPEESFQVTAENNTIQGCLYWPYIADGADDNVFRNNICTLMGANVRFDRSQRSLASGNYVATVSQQGSTYNGIIETGASDYTTILNNTVVVVSSVVGAHSTVSGDTIIPRPSFTPVYANPPSSTITTVTANDLLVVNTRMYGRPQIQSPFTALQTANQPTPLGTAVFAPGYRLLTSAGPQTASWTNTEVGPWSTAMLALKGSAALVQQIDAGQMAPAWSSLTPSTTGGTIPTGTYYYRWAGVYHGGEFLTGEDSASVIGPTGSVALVANLNNGPAFPSYKIYKGTAPGVYTTYFTTTSLSFTDTGAAGTAGSLPTALSFTGTLGATPTNGDAVVLAYYYWAGSPTSLDLSSVSVGGVALTKGPAITFPWGIVSIWHVENVQGAANGIVTVTLTGNIISTDTVGFNASEWSGVATSNAVDAQMTTSFPLTW